MNDNAKDLIANIKAMAEVNRQHFDILTRIASKDTGITNAAGQEPGELITQDLQFQVTNQLNYLHNQLPRRKEWFNSSEARLITAEQNFETAKQLREAEGVEVEFAGAVEARYVGSRYYEINQARYLPMLAQYGALKEQYKELFGKEYVYTKDATVQNSNSIKVNPDKLKDLMAAPAEAKTAATG